MPGLKAKLPWSSRRTTKRSARSRPYVFMVTLLAVFLLGLLVFRVPIQGYLAGAAISVRLADDAGLPDDRIAEAIHRELASDERLKRAVESAGLDAGTRLEPLRDAVGVRLGPTDSFGRALVEVSYLGSDRREAVSLVEHLAADYVCSIQEQERRLASERPLRTQQSRLARARQREAAAAAARDAFLAEYLDALTADSPAQSSNESAPPDEPAEQAASAESAGHGADQSSAGEPSIIVRVYPDSPSKSTHASGPPPAAPQTQVNPDWLTLEQQAAAVEQKRAELLNEYTAVHPLIRRLDDELRQVRQQIERTPRFIPAPGDADRAGAADSASRQHPDDNAAAWQQAAAQRQAAEQRAAELRKQFAALTEAYVAAQAERSQIEQQLADRPAADAPLVCDAHRAGAAQLVGRVGGTPSRGQLALLGLVAALAAGATALLVGKPLQAGVFYRVEDVRQRLAVPVVASLPTGDGPPLPVDRPAHRWVSTISAACELTLVAVVVGFVLVALVESEVTQQFAADPLGCIGEAVSRVSSGRL